MQLTWNHRFVAVCLVTCASWVLPSLLWAEATGVSLGRVALDFNEK